MRSYGQYCAIAKALDAVGDRWTLLIVRELLLHGRCRYTDIRAGLPGIATNLLADRLTALEAAGIIQRETARPPVATDLFSLTARGMALAPVLAALGRWGGPLMTARADTEAFRSRWLAWPLRLHLTDREPDAPPITLELRSGDEPMLIETVGDGSVRVRSGAAEHPDAILSGAPDIVVWLLVGRLTLAQARARGLRYQGNVKVLRRVQPDVRPAGAGSNAGGE